jgi:hypothetical protein
MLWNLKIQKRRIRFLFSDAFIFFLLETPKRFVKGVAVPACTHSNRDFLYSEKSQRRSFPVSIQSSFHHSCCASRAPMPLGFLLGGFSSTAGYVPGNEAQQSFPREKRERRSTSELIISLRR